ncbi:hypothetical protein OAJ10_02460 [Paracoccaceae bacterium]|nr:hypothetical protein [Paracoccaceae bacterium]
MKSLIKSKVANFKRIIRIRNIPFYVKKKIARKALMSKAPSGYLHELAKNGAIKCTGIIDQKIIDNWISKYDLNVDNIIPSKGNLAFPFFNKDVEALLTDSQLSKLLDEYFLNIYGCKPVLQMMPYLVITYPNIRHDEYDAKVNNFPADWHTDYQSEFTIHVPLVEINSENTHTMYAINTHTSLLKAPKTDRDMKELFRSFGKKTDALFLDVDGWHQGRLEGKGARIMIQFKFTVGNDLLFHPTGGISIKQQEQIERTKNNIKNYETVGHQLKEDFSYAKNLSSDDPKLSIIQDNAQAYLDYI